MCVSHKKEETKTRGSTCAIYIPRGFLHALHDPPLAHQVLVLDVAVVQNADVRVERHLHNVCRRILLAREAPEQVKHLGSKGSER